MTLTHQSESKRGCLAIDEKKTITDFFSDYNLHFSNPISICLNEIVLFFQSTSPYRAFFVCLKLFLLFSFPLRKKNLFIFLLLTRTVAKEKKYTIFEVLRGGKHCTQTDFPKKFIDTQLTVRFNPQQSLTPHCLLLFVVIVVVVVVESKASFMSIFLAISFYTKLGGFFWIRYTLKCVRELTHETETISCYHALIEEREKTFLVIRRRSFFAWTPQKILNVTLCWCRAFFFYHHGKVFALLRLLPSQQRRLV